jgi:hypothetical protein
MNRSLKLTIIVLSVFSLTGCFNELDILESDDQIPYQARFNFRDSIQQSMYTHQSYYSLHDSCIVQVIENNSWDIAFPGLDKPLEIRLNSSAQLGIYASNANTLQQAIPIPNNAEWLFDASSGTPDSLAVLNWIDTLVTPWVLDETVYVLGKNNGVSFDPVYKFKIFDFNGKQITVQFAGFNSTTGHTQQIKLLPGCQQQLFSFKTHEIIQSPPDESWDLLFTSYTTTLYAGSVAVPYQVRGVLLNPHHIEVGKIYFNQTLYPSPVMAFSELGINSFDTVSFSKQSDYIGWDWKKVNMEEASYVVDFRKIYAIKSPGMLYKLQFASYYQQLDNNSLEKGYPTFYYGGWYR